MTNLARAPVDTTLCNPKGREKIRALLVDDDAVDCLLISRLAARSKHLEFDLTVCRNLEEAHSLASQRFDVAYIDYWMGSETSIHFIHTFARMHDVPCILLTSLDEPDIRRVAFRAGAEAFLSKAGISIQALESVTLAVLRHHATL
jgi:CheY-like chemotaxis protein